MEEMWKDISLASLNEHPADSIVSSRTTNPDFRSTILLDFLARPIDIEPPTQRTSHVSSGTSVTQGSTLFESQSPTLRTILSLNSGSDLEYAESGDLMSSNPAVNAPTGSSHNSTGFNGFASSAISPFCIKRAPESDGNSNDRRHKRMMKNRESAARSRARKQAYTFELEIEVARLEEENAKLRKQQQKLLSAPEQLPKKSLTRTSTAPF